MTGELSFPSRPHKLRWVRDTGGIFIFPSGSTRYLFLTGWEAYCWEWVMGGMHFEQIVAFSADFLQIEIDVAERRVNTLLQDWAASRLFDQEGAGGG